MYRKQQRSALLTIPVGASDGEYRITDLPPGDKLYMGVQAKPIQPSFVNVSLELNGDVIVRPSDVSWFDGSIGPFENRALEIEDRDGSEFDIKVRTLSPVVDNPLYVQVVFQVWQKSSECNY